MRSKRRGDVSDNIKKNISLLKVLSKAKASARKNILANCDSSLTKAICECTKNVLSGRVDVSPSVYRKLKPYARHLRKITHRGTPLPAKTKVIQQHGGFLGALLGALLPIIIGGVTRAISG